MWQSDVIEWNDVITGEEKLTAWFKTECAITRSEGNHVIVESCALS